MWTGELWQGFVAGAALMGCLWFLATEDERRARAREHRQGRTGAHEASDSTRRGGEG